jgi:hypothetical protein
MVQKQQPVSYRLLPDGWKATPEGVQKIR